MFVSTMHDHLLDEALAFLFGADGYVCNVKIGYDDKTGTTYNLYVALTPRAGMAGLRVFDLDFAVIETQSDGSHISDWWDGSRSRGVIADPDERMLVMTMVCAAVRTLVRAAEPAGIVMTTHTPNLPIKALVKYERIEKAILEHGYEGGKSDCRYGCWLWEFSHVADQGNLAGDQPLMQSGPQGDET